jgi:Fe-S cluster assembly protein SufD
VLVNGQYQQKLSSLPAHVTVMSLMEAAEKKVKGLEDQLVRVGDLAAQPLMALNSAYLRDGFVLAVDAHKDIEKPVEVLFFNTGKDAAIYPRVLYSLGENSGLTVVERHYGEGSYLANAYVAVAQESASRLKFYRFVDESEAGAHVSQTVVQMQKDASFEGFSLASGGRLARQEFRLLLIDRAISSSIGGTYLMKGQQSHDFTVVSAVPTYYQDDKVTILRFWQTILNRTENPSSILEELLMIRLVQFSKGKYMYVVLHKKQMDTSLIMRYCFPQQLKQAQNQS